MKTWPQILIDTDSGYRLCFGCGPDNPIGLKLSFQWDGQTARSEFTPGPVHQGWPGVVHGGIIACLLDEASSYAALFAGMYCVTAEMRVKLTNPAPIDEPLIITSSVIKKTRKLVETRASVSLKDGTQIAEGMGKQMVIKPEPGHTESSKAVIWDMDGVIADTGPYHLRGWQAVFKKMGISYTAADFRHHTGKRNDSIIKGVLGEATPPDEITAIIREKDKNFRRLVEQKIRPLPGVLELITSLKEYGFKIAIASSATMENIRLVTRGLNIDNCFDAIISGWEVTRGKPDPQTFLLAAEKLGVKAEDCIVIEDAISGVTASKRAGMTCLAVTNTTPREELGEADLIVDTLEDITAADLERLLHRR